ncbi:hypothetical protein NW768_001147 [Fusarium equiseti]|uniref:Uncharacterized protein n=1 Tax=Fusarium equiseti TaxID=61235 RepID=A0ABQ8RPF2_FUSEQ|nr:hypothetical protein NW768_001147 [Fusarium equiseti]
MYMMTLPALLLFLRNPSVSAADSPMTKELRKKGRKALSAFRAITSAKAATSAAAASEQRRSERDAQSAAVSSEILATLVDIRNSLAIIANYGLPQAGAAQMPDDGTWNTSDDDDDDD